MHKAVEPLAFLLGKWLGRGKGNYPTVDSFTYTEELNFWHVGNPWIGYSQQTWSPEGSAMHAETGYFRPKRDNKVEIVIAHALGVTEIQEGTFDGTRIEVTSTSLSSTTTADKIRQLARTFDVDGDKMTYELKMAYEAVPLQTHLGAELKREP